MKLPLCVLLLCLANIFFVPLLLADVEDVKGWNGLEWGMSKKEIHSILGSNIQPVPNSESLSIESIIVDGFNFKVLLKIANNSLENISMQPIDKSDRKVFEQLEQYLIEKYGHPTQGYSSAELVDLSDRKWIFQTTTIELSLIDLGDSNLLYINFAPTSEEDRRLISKKGTEYDFRKIYWGMSEDQVKRNESSSLIKEYEDVLNYSVELKSISATLIYGFASDKLVSAAYVFNPTYINPNNYIRDYESVNSFLKSKYGTTSNKLPEQEWSNSLYKNDPENWGNAVSIGHLTFVNTWETDSTQVIHMLIGENFEIRHYVLYKSIKLSYLQDEEDKKELNEQF